MSENSTLIGYEGRTISREELALVPTPLATETHRPEGDDRAGLEIGNHIHASSTAGSAALLHSDQNESLPPVLELPAPSQPGLLAANPRIINLYLPAQPFPSRIHHRPAELV